MKLLVVDNTEPADRSFNEPLLATIAKVADFDVNNYRAVSPDIIAEYSGVILGGVPLGYGFDTIEDRANRLKWLHDKDVPVLGVCLGHQSLGQLFGASVVRDVEAERGPRTIQQLAPYDELFEGVPPEFQVYAHHRGSISLPADFILLASSEDCRNQAMRHITRPLYGLQFHPEYSSPDISRQLFDNFAKIAASYIGKVEREVETLPEPEPV